MGQQGRRGATRRQQTTGAFDRWLNIIASVAVSIAILVGLAAVLAHLFFSP